ncbi:MAG: GNAT family N-acetyltransferase [Actinobacteria bacterium]|nr:GNAT family N-acetyltransferase [Actinomycetota bacterium]
MDIELRAVKDEAEAKRFMIACEATFGDELTDDDWKDFKNVLESDRTIAAFDGDDIIGTAAAFSFRLTVPGGGEVRAAGVTVVGVLPSHRRKGVATKMMRKQLDDVRAAGEPVAILWASEGSIYQRFGYGLATVGQQIDIPRTKTRLLNDPDRVGTVKVGVPMENVGDLSKVYDRARSERPGMVARSEKWWKHHTLRDPERHRDGGGPRFSGILEIDSEPAAYALYRMHHKWDDGSPQGHIEVKELVATSPVAEREMWRFVFDIDLTASVKAWWLPQDSPLMLMLMEPRSLKARASDSIWARIVDVPGAFEARSYNGSGEVVIDVSDDFCPWNEGRWSFDISDGKARITKTDADADIKLHARELGALYLGAFTFAELERALRVETWTEGAIGRADDLFRTARKPWNPEIF